MGNEQGAGYLVLDLRLTEAEKDIATVSAKLENHISKNDDEHKEMRNNIVESNLSVREIKLLHTQMFTNLVEMKENFKETSDEIKKDVKAMSAKNDKDNGWRAIIIDLIKVILMILGFIAGGKIIL